jgi:hypothetical protein
MGCDGTGCDGTGYDSTGCDGTGCDGTGCDGTGCDGTGCDGTGCDGMLTLLPFQKPMAPAETFETPRVPRYQRRCAVVPR